MTIRPSIPGELPEVETTVDLPAPAGWYSGDTHEHIQYCDNTLHPIGEILARMQAEGLNVGNVLIWHRPLLPFTQHVCSVTGRLDPLSSTTRLLQYGVETSGLSCARWGHLIGLGIGPAQARIAQGTVATGACADMAGLGLGGDGSGVLVAPIAQRFFGAPRAVCGYAHTVWPMGLHHPDGYDWNTELVQSGFTTDAICLDPGQKLAVPPVDRLMGIGFPSTSIRAFFPLLGAMDAVLGNVQFFETIVMGAVLPVPTSPPAHWNAMYYKLLSAGVRVALSGGSDRACPYAAVAGLPHPRSYALVERFFTYHRWTAALAAGRVSVARGRDLFLRSRLEGQEVGSEIQLSSPGASATATVDLTSRIATSDTIELIVNGEVRDTRPVVLDAPGTKSVSFDDVPFSGSSWVAVRLGSQLAHTGAFYVIVDGRPIADCEAAEYWMLWCDIVTKSTLDHPELHFFESQEAEALALIAQARNAFKALRDLALGFEPSWSVTRYGASTPGQRGPIAIGTTGPARRGEKLRLTCTNAPPLADGFLRLSRAKVPDGRDEVDIRSFVAADPGALIGSYPARATRSGYSEVEVPPPPGQAPVLHAQFIWTNPGAGGAGRRRSASDALEMRVAGGA